MANQETDILKADPIETLDKGSKISLQGGGAVLVLFAAFVYQNNEADWHVSQTILLVLVVVAAVMALASSVLRYLDAKLRCELTLALLKLKGTSSAADAKDMPVVNQVPQEVIDRILQGPIINYAIAPGTQPVDTTPPAPS